MQTADAALLVVALDDPACLDAVAAVHSVLRDKRVELSPSWELAAESLSEIEPPTGDPFALRLPTLLLANKADRLGDPEPELQAFLEVTGLRYPAFAVSAHTGHGLGVIGAWLFEHLGIVRIYTKMPGRPAARDRPFIVHRGQTVEDVARLVHDELARSLKSARVWGRSGFDGQHVGRRHRLADGDVVELHS